MTQSGSQTTPLNPGSTAPAPQDLMTAALHLAHKLQNPPKAKGLVTWRNLGDKHDAFIRAASELAAHPSFSKDNADQTAEFIKSAAGTERTSWARFGLTAGTLVALVLATSAVYQAALRDPQLAIPFLLSLEAVSSAPDTLG